MLASLAAGDIGLRLTRSIHKLSDGWGSLWPSSDACPLAFLIDLHYGTGFNFALYEAPRLSPLPFSLSFTSVSRSAVVISTHAVGSQDPSSKEIIPVCPRGPTRPSGLPVLLQSPLSSGSVTPVGLRSPSEDFLGSPGPRQTPASPDDCPTRTEFFMAARCASISGARRRAMQLHQQCQEDQTVPHTPKAEGLPSTVSSRISPESSPSQQIARCSVNALISRATNWSAVSEAALRRSRAHRATARFRTAAGCRRQRCQ